MHPETPFKRPEPLGDRYFPAICPARHRPFIVKVGEAAANSLARMCPECGAPSQFIPGAYYSESFLPTLRRVIEIIDGARLSARRAEAAARELRAVSWQPSPRKVQAVLSDYMTLQPLDTLLPRIAKPEDQQTLRGFIGLVVALLSLYAEDDGASSGSAPGGRSSSASGTYRMTGWPSPGSSEAAPPPLAATRPQRRLRKSWAG